MRKLNLDNRSELVKQSFSFAVEMVGLYNVLSKDKREFVLSKQPLRSSTSVGANIREAQNAISKADFAFKLSIAQKECDESIYWLELLYETDYINKEQFEELSKACTAILKMLRSAILTTRKKMNS